MAKVRYWEGRDDFSVKQTSSIKVSVEGSDISHHSFTCNTVTQSSFAFDNNALELISSFDFIMKGSRLILKVDPGSSGNWVDCITMDNLDLPTGWVEKSRFGITATTGL
jgi:hypothetical protein